MLSILRNIPPYSLLEYLKIRRIQKEAKEEARAEALQALEKVTQIIKKKNIPEKIYTQVPKFPLGTVVILPLMCVCGILAGMCI